MKNKKNNKIFHHNKIPKNNKINNKILINIRKIRTNYLMKMIKMKINFKQNNLLLNKWKNKNKKMLLNQIFLLWRKMQQLKNNKCVNIKVHLMMIKIKKILLISIFKKKNWIKYKINK